MITRQRIIEAARYTDAQLSELGDSIETWAEHTGIDLRALAYVADQRALRLGLIYDGKDPRKLSRTHFSSVQLSERARLLVPTFAAAWMDGCAIGIAVERGSE